MDLPLLEAFLTGLEILLTGILQGTVFGTFPVITVPPETDATFFGITGVVTVDVTVILGFLILRTSPNDQMSSNTNSRSHLGSSVSKSSLTFKGKVNQPYLDVCTYTCLSYILHNRYKVMSSPWVKGFLMFSIQTSRVNFLCSRAILNHDCTLR